MLEPPTRPPGAIPVERVRGEHPPSDAGWRADALAGSLHSRLLDEIREPLEDRDPDNADKLCAEITRSILGDLAPALMLVPAGLRRRVRVLTAFALTLFDFAFQRGLDGDRLAEINRWEFALEQALAGDPPGQPIFVLMAVEERRQPWRREALDRLFALARGRAMGRTSPSAESSRELAGALAEALVGRSVAPQAAVFAAAVIGLRARQSQGRRPSKSDLEPIRPALEAGPGPLPAPWARPARYVHLASLSLERTAARKGGRPPILGVAARISFLLRAAVTGAKGRDPSPRPESG